MVKDVAMTRSHNRRSTRRRLDQRAPPSLRLLTRLFASLEFGLGALMLYQHMPDFAAVKSAVESSCQLSFTPVHLQQILHLLPGAYILDWKKKSTRTAHHPAQEESVDSTVAKRQRLKKQPLVLTLRKQHLLAPDDDCKSLEARITLFVSKANFYVDGHVKAMKQEFPDMTDDELIRALKHVEIEKAPLPPVPRELLSAGTSSTMLSNNDKKQTSDIAGAQANEKLTEALAKPIPEDLKSLPEWLINKVRKQEVGRKDIVDNGAKALKRRLLSSLPRLSDQLLSLMMVTRKSIFSKAYLLRRLAAQAPIKGKVEEQLYLLESLVPEWLTVVLDDGNEYIKISTSCKYDIIKASLRRAISVQA